METSDGTSEPGVMLDASLHGLVGRHAELDALLSDLASATRAEPGCRSYRILRGEEPGEIVLLSVFADQEALRAHFATPHYRRYREQVGPLLARPSDVIVHYLSSSVRALDPNPPDPGMLG